MIKNSFFKTGIDQKFESEVSFKIVNAKSGVAITNPTIYLNNTVVTYTYSSNYYRITVPVKGIFNIKVVKEDYNDATNSYSFETLENASISMVPVQTAGEMNIAVTWDHSGSRDIDSHTYINVNGVQKQVFYNTKNYTDSNTTVTLDRDDTGDDTGENTSITPVYSDYDYHFWLCDYDGSTDATGFADKAVTVSITYNNVTITYTTPAGSKGKYWDVFTVTNGTVNMINTYSNTQP